MNRSPQQLREDALAIWQAGVAAVQSDRLVRENVRVEGSHLLVGDKIVDLAPIQRIVVVGTGKAGAGMAQGIEVALGEPLMAEKKLVGWINVPADCVRELSRIKLHPARPAGVNEPTEEGVAGTEQILRLVGALGPNDLCLCLISGGGSALMPAPVDGISLQDKQAVTKFLSAAGANILQLNTVRKQLSRVKGNGLARACRAGRLISLIISDVIGDPLDIIASGPTVSDPSTPTDAIKVLDQFAGRAEIEADALKRVEEHLASGKAARAGLTQTNCEIANLVIGNNAAAVDAAGVEAKRRGYSHAMSTSTQMEGFADDIGRHLAKMALRMRDEPGPDCLITGGEPVVELAPQAKRGRGGRNQQLVLAALTDLLGQQERLADIALLSGGTDGEDGPTDAAGAVINHDIAGKLRDHPLDPSDFLSRNDAYSFFEPLDALIKTGPTHTNVCDVRVVVVNQKE